MKRKKKEPAAMGTFWTADMSAVLCKESVLIEENQDFNTEERQPLTPWTLIRNEDPFCTTRKKLPYMKPVINVIGTRFG